jgi:hypothetical protein
MATQNPSTKATRKPGQTRTPQEKVAEGKAPRDARKAPPPTRRVFAPGQCHHRNAAGEPDCKKRIEAKRANLCPTHEAEWQKAARVRYAARRAQKAEEGPAADLTRQLEASVAAFATPELAAKARAKRAAQRGTRK